MMTKRVLICGNPDLNFIDGSSIWAQTIALATAATGRTQVDFLAKSTPERDELFSSLMSASNMNIIDGTKHSFWQGKKYKRLTLPMMADLAVVLDSDKQYDVIIVRGLEIATHLLTSPNVVAKCWMYLTDIPQSISEYSPEQRKIITNIAYTCNLLLCQTQGFKELWQALAPSLEESKLRIYSPVIPDLPQRIPSIEERPLQAIYAGKFKGEWMTLEMANLWPLIHNRVSGSELVIIGDKIHNEPDYPDYKNHMQSVLENTPGLTWLGAQSRELVQEQLQSARVGLSWRAESMNDTVEYSTKLLEYGGAGCAAIINRNSLHEKLLGRDYPLFVNSPEEFVEQLTRVLNEPKVAQQAADVLMELAKRHTFSMRVAEIREWLDISNTKQKTCVLVAGHDLKFFNLLQRKLEATGQFEFLVDQWEGHNKHDEERSRALLKQADVIFCEWCLGNLKWYSQNKASHQRLVARFHLQERELPYVAESNWDNINHISYVSEYIRREGQKVFGFPYEKTSVIPNLLDEKKFTTEKKVSDARYTLGIIGVAPARKRLDRAIDLLEELLKKDSRYCLRVKGKHPLDYAWLLKREEELVYYRQIFERINSNPVLRHKVIFDPPGDDINQWFTLVGFILSPSDFESFHMAIGEGMLTGSVPVIWNWDGADEIWGREWVVNSLFEATNVVLNSSPRDEIAEQILNTMSSHDISECWKKVIQEQTTT
ncbi:glycosyltransferase [Leclercia sp.]|uniref:glycosyltransferase family protein n=1 Tax=Leclercia sp. TaxID=1898428 RepID=UPI00289D38C6|nr:glycosyltransferase [Leclercia sp.]